jgi:DNA helicase-2/ATP-dependent DNA helicase PcrA
MSLELNSQQEKAVKAGEGPLLIVAGAGSGKTLTLLNRLLHLIHEGIPANEIIAITFTNKAADEMKTRMVRLLPSLAKDGSTQVFPMFIGTFHSFGARLLREQAHLFGRTPHFTIFDNEDSLRLIKNILSSFNISRDALNPLHVAGEISHLKNELKGPEETSRPNIRKVFETYEEELKKNNAFDFDDLIEKAAVLFQEHPKILDYYQKKIRYVLVDEFQDINISQYELVRLLVQAHHNINAVGDDAQSIYKFRGSDFRIFLNFEKDWPEAKTVFLEENYRSTKTIIAAASALISKNIHQKRKELWTNNGSGNLIQLIMAGSEDEEAMWMAKRILTLQDSFKSSPESIAILYRTNAQSRSIEQALITLRIPYKISGGLRFYDRQEIRDIVAGLRFLANPQDRFSLERLTKTFPKKIHEPLIAELSGMDTKRPIIELISRILTLSRYEDYLERKFKNADERKENIQELIAFAGQFDSLPVFLERITLLQSSENPRSASFQKSGRPPIQLMTIHLAKGLEFDHVFVAGCEEGTLPHHRSFSSRDELEEERRLMYVAMTRAKKTLALTFSRLPSRFLFEFPESLTEFTHLNNERVISLDEDDVYIE